MLANLALASALSALPILLILVLMLVSHWSAARAGLAGLGVTLLLAVIVFGYGRTRYPDVGVARALAGAGAEAAFSAATILWILLPALGIHHLALRTGSVEVLRRALTHLSGDRRLLSLLVAWFFALFMEGAAGFGAPIALAAPLLVGLGFPPVDALAAALVGHAIGVSFGAVGTPVLPQMAATGFTGLALSRAIGVYHALLGWIMALVLLRIVSRALGHDTAPQHGPIRWTLLAAALFIVPFFAIARWVGPELPSLGGGLLGGLGFALVLRFASQRGSVGHDNGEDLPSGRRLMAAGAPYLALVAVILLTRLVPPLQRALRDVSLEWSLFGQFRGDVLPLYHPGTMLFVALGLGALWQRVPWRDLGASLRQSALRLGDVAVALGAMLALSRLMVHAGMIDVLAEGAARALGDIWPLLAPQVGMLGAFITGSATASNILFSDFQVTTARDLGLPILPMMGLQGFGAAVGNIICPHNIIAGGAAVGLAGQEGKVLRRTLAPALLYSTLGGLLALLWLAR